MADTTRVSVPKELGGEIVVSWNGDDPQTYKVTNGHVEVENENVERFILHFDGAEVASDATHSAPATSSKKEES